MKKIKFSPLKMDKKTIAKLDAEQLEKIRGGVSGEFNSPNTSSGCKDGTTCNSGGSCNARGSGAGDC